MSRLEELIQELCPNGVEWKSLEELGVFLGGLTGKSKDDFKDGNANFITYMNVFSNPGLNLHDDAKVKVADGENQRRLEYGDVIFTGSSEIAEECAYTSVVCEVPEEDYYLNSFCFILRLNEVSLFNPHFLKHLFRSSYIRQQLVKTANGVTRFNVSKEKMKKVRIPVPPMEVQCEIVHILDQFTLLTAKLTAELIARKQQYEYYRDFLFDFNNEIELYKLNELCDITRGKRVVKSQLEEAGDYPVFQNTLLPMGYFTRWNCEENSTYVVSAGSAGEIGFCSSKSWMADDCLFFKNCNNIYNKFIYYFLKSKQEYIKTFVRKASVPRLSREVIENLMIPVPPLEEQQRIVDILDIFYAYCNDLTQGLPAEIELRKQQYEYYRDKLLSFKELK